MLETLINLSVIVLACVYIGLILGKRSTKGDVSKLVDSERDKIREEIQQEQQELAVELHGELSKVRDSIVQSAHAYQSVVNKIGEKLAPWEEVQKSLSADARKELPLLIVEGSSVEQLKESKSEDIPTGDSTLEDEGPSLQEKAKALIKEDRAAYRVQAKSSESVSNKAEAEETTTEAVEISLNKDDQAEESSTEKEAKKESKIPNATARFAH